MNRQRTLRSTTLRACAALLCSAPIFAAHAQAADGLGEDGTALILISGSLVESACQLAMSSTLQAIDLGELTSAQLQRAGDQGSAVALQLELQGCIRSEGGRQDSQLGTLTWSASEPVLSVTFRAVADSDTPALVKVQGAEGFGLRLTDALHRDVQLGRSAPPWFVAPGSNVLTYYIKPERTAAPLRPGNFQASLNIHLAYD